MLYFYVKRFQVEKLSDPRMGTILNDIIDRLVPALFTSQKKGTNTKEELEVVKDTVLEMVTLPKITFNNL